MPSKYFFEKLWFYMKYIAKNAGDEYFWPGTENRRNLPFHPGVK